MFTRPKAPVLGASQVHNIDLAISQVQSNTGQTYLSGPSKCVSDTFARPKMPGLGWHQVYNVWT